jgi:hypothetical protein
MIKWLTDDERKTRQAEIEKSVKECFDAAGFDPVKRIKELEGLLDRSQEINDEVCAEKNKRIEALEAQLDRTCEWSVSDHRDNEYWSSSCGEDWMFIDGGPE